MNDKKLEKLFAAARNESTPVLSQDLVADVLRAIRRAPITSRPETFSVFDQLNWMFPKLAPASAVAIILCIAADFVLTTTGTPGLRDGVSQISAQWLLTLSDF